MGNLGSAYRQAPAPPPATAIDVTWTNKAGEPPAQFGLPIVALYFWTQAGDRDPRFVPDLVMALVPGALVRAFCFALAVLATWISIRVWMTTKTFKATMHGDGENVRYVVDGKERFCVSLSSIDDVVLDREIIPAGLGGSTLRAPTRFLNKWGIEADRSRIQFVLGSGTTFNLQEGCRSDVEIAELYPRVRLFLRRRGWVPIDERS